MAVLTDHITDVAHLSICFWQILIRYIYAVACLWHSCRPSSSVIVYCG